VLAGTVVSTVRIRFARSLAEENLAVEKLSAAC
jgi:hypothetical protein